MVPSNRPTENLNHNFRQSVGAGMKSVFGDKGRTFYILQHKTNTPRFKAGREQEIIIDYIELGRDPKCQIRFDESQKTVSRRHAAITREGSNWVLRNLSQTNPTLINGRPVNVQWFLNNGDEIQLSLEGPKLGFINPSNNMVSSLPLSRRLSLFRQQALRPYKQVMVVMSVLFVLAVAGLSFGLWKLSGKNEKLGQDLVAAVNEGQKMQGNIDSMKVALGKSEERNEALQKQMRSLNKKVKQIQSRPAAQADPTAAALMPDAQAGVEDLRQFYPSVYYITVKKIAVSFEGEEEEITDYKWTGTGFLLTDGRFVTARHIVEPWYFFDTKDIDAAEVLLNLYCNNGGEIVTHFTAYAPDGKKINFKSTDFVVDRSGDESITINVPDSDATALVTHAMPDDGKDWAVYKTSRNGLIRYSATLSQSLPVKAQLHVLGYPLGLGANSPSDLQPVYGRCTVSREGLNKGIILINDRNYEHGSSGGPAFYLENGQYVAVGIISTAVGDQSGYIVPISGIR